jgi:copper chaperone NosL
MVASRLLSRILALGFPCVLPLLGCTDAGSAPTIRLDQTACARCGMLVSELGGAAAYRATTGKVRAYDDLACLLADREAGVGADVEPAAIWVYDQRDGRPLRATEAAFVLSRHLRTPMGGGFAAFGDLAAAAAFRDTAGGEVLGWHDLASANAAIEREELEGVKR